ncbi:MAG: flagellar hook-associated protein FlgL [Acidimicrobiales bacterium]|nr:flagellar hook-associated protein FlgL [Acidimicrobiales bacterium]
MRVTNAGHYQILQENIRRTSAGQASATERIASGRKYSRLSEDPDAIVKAMRLRGEEQQLETYTGAASDARAWLATQDGALQSATNVLQRVRELTIAASNDALSDDAVAGLAQEIEGLRGQLVVLANTRFQDRSVFAGFADQTVTMSGSAATFTGDAGEVNRRVGSGQLVQVNVSGGEVFGFTAGDDVFSVLTDIADHIRARDVASLSGTDLDRVDARFSDVTANLGRVGARMNVVDQAEAVAVDQIDAVRLRRSNLEDVDMAEAAVELTAAQNAYEAVIAMVGRLQMPTLANFLR